MSNQLRKSPALVLLALLLFLNLASAVDRPFGVYEGATYSPTITVLESSSSVIRLDLTMDNLPDNATINFQQHQDGLWGELNQTGSLMPRFTIWLALPPTGDPIATIEQWETADFNASPHTIPENLTNSDQVKIGNVGIMGGVRLVPVTIRPFDYTNGASTCNIFSHAIIRFDISGPGTNPVTNPPTEFSVPWQKVFRSVATNWEYIPNINTNAASHILMIVPDEYLTGIESFVNWKRQRGIYVTVVAKSDIATNPTSTQIRNRIISEVEASSPRIDFVILAGDETKLAVSFRDTDDPISRFSDVSEAIYSPYTDEGVYCMLEGTDLFPDVFLGRWIINSASEIQNVVNRTVQHEKDTFLADSLRFQQCIVSADNSVPTQIMTKSYVRQMLLGHGFSTVDSIFAGEFFSPEEMINQIIQGATLVNHRGSGWNFGWAGINFWTSNISSVSNPGKLPIITGIGCGVAKFDVPDEQCFGEVWMHSGSPGNPKGAVGFIGPCWNTHTVYNDILDSCLYRAFLDYDVLNLSTSLAAGKMFAWAMFADFLSDYPPWEDEDLEITNIMMRQYLVLSDPSLQVFTRTPQRVTVAAPEAIPSGPTTVDVTVSGFSNIDADSVLVTIWTQDGAFASAWASASNPQVSIPANAASAEDAVLTVTGENVLAYFDSITVGPAEAYVVHGSLEIDDVSGNNNGQLEPGESVNWLETAWNIGGQTATNVQSVLRSQESAITITDSTASFGNIPSTQQSEASSPYVLSVAPEDPNTLGFSFDILFTVTGQPDRISTVTVPVYVPDMDLLTLDIYDDDNDGLIERGENSDLGLSVRNNGNTPLVAGTAELISNDPLITVTSDAVPYSAIPAGSEFDFADNAFSLLASIHTPSAHQANLVLRVTSAMGTYTYVRDMPIVLTIGEVTSSDPFADNANMYWVYDNTDTVYDQHPEFDWFEIAPNADGPGTALNVVGGQQTFPLALPFQFNYYGLTFDSLSVSTDGWLAPGRTILTNNQNTQLPNVTDLIVGMIAPLWLNLWSSSGETGQICYYYDSVEDRYIVEWYQVHEPSPAHQFQETFQVQLLNPDTHPTQTGDAEWVFLYQEVSTRATSIVGATVGFESRSEINGATYVFQNGYVTGAAPLQVGRAIKLSTNSPTILPAGPVPPQIPSTMELSQNYPNPFNPDTRIDFALTNQDNVRLEIFDLLGRKISTLVDGNLSAGHHTKTWFGKTDSGASVVSGIYFYRLSTTSAVLTRKMILMR